MRDPKRTMCAAVLALEAVALGLSTPVLIAVAGLSVTAGLTVGLGLTVLCLVAAGLLRSPAGYALGWVVQALAIGTGFVITAMFVLGLIFGALWWTAVWLGVKIERERAALGGDEGVGTATEESH